MKLTELQVRKAAPGEKPRKLADGGGMYLLIAPTGGKLWRLKYRVDGKEKVLALGRYPDVGLAEARARREEARRQIARGIDPSAERVAERDYPLINGFFNVTADQKGFLPLIGQKPMTLQAYVGPLSGSVEEGFSNKPLAGSQVLLKQPLQDVVNEATEISNAVNAAQIPYRAQSTNSNAFANTTYQHLTGKVPPDQENATGADTKLPFVPPKKPVQSMGGSGGGGGSQPTVKLCHIVCD